MSLLLFRNIVLLCANLLTQKLTRWNFLTGRLWFPCVVCTSETLSIPSDLIFTFFNFPSGHNSYGKSFSSSCHLLLNLGSHWSTYFGWSELEYSRSTSVSKLYQPNIEMILIIFSILCAIPNNYWTVYMLWNHPSQNPNAIFLATIFSFWCIQVTTNLQVQMWT